MFVVNLFRRLMRGRLRIEAVPRLWAEVLPTAVLAASPPALVLAQSAPLPTVLQAEPAADWNARFAGKQGWIGGDEAYSVVLGRQRVLWLFGDSLLGTVRDGKRAGAVMLNNTIALQVGPQADAPLRFLTGKAPDGKPTAFFLPVDGRGWLWPQAAARDGNRLLVFLSQIERGDRPGVLDFRHVSQWLAIIDNPDEDPAHWHIQQHRVPFAVLADGRSRSWGSALLADGNTLFVYGYQEQGKQLGSRKLLVARVPAGKLADFAAWRFRTSTGWSPRPEDAQPLAAGLATELSVTPLSDAAGYLLVYTENGLGDRIVGRVASSPAGPWSAPILLYCCPEMARDRGVFCYAAKAHSWAARDRELLLSYCTNTWDFSRLFQENQVYRPRLVRVKLQAPGQGVPGAP